MNLKIVNNDDTSKKKVLFDTSKVLIICNILARKEGILALDTILDNFIKNNPLEDIDRDLLMVGLKFVIDGTDEKFIDEYFNNRINLFTSQADIFQGKIIKTGIKCIQKGIHPSIQAYLLDSLIPDHLRYENNIKKLLDEEQKDVLIFGEAIV